MKKQNIISIVLIICMGFILTSCSSVDSDLESALENGDVYSDIPKSDMDNDNVYDSVDSCPGTPEGEIVDENGCTFAQLTHNSDTDDDTAANTDGDSDGYTPADGDCNDSNAAIHPDATEIPNNGIDEDCDGSDLLVVIKYALTVSGGTGGSNYAAGDVVTITANTAPSGQVFDCWVVSSGSGSPTIANISALSTTLTMPASAATVTATYMDLPPGTYTLTVINGSGSGNYVSGANVTIIASNAPEGQEFDKWTGSVNFLFNTIYEEYLSTTTVRMSASAATVTATYKNRQYALTVNDGSGGGNYSAGSTVSIEANVAPEGYVFSYWELNSGNPYILNINGSSTDLTMTANVAEITAKYNDLSLLDTDGDEVTDDIDACPDTQPDAYVDEFGCVYYPHPIPDTGQTICYNEVGDVITCPTAETDPFYGQDAHYTINPPSYTKLDSSGDELLFSATEWVMVRDNVTGLIWEVKTDDDSVHDKDNLYSWYDSNPLTNGGNSGTEDDGTHSNTEVFISSLNSDGFGGFSDWRLPNAKELISIVDYGGPNPSVNEDYFKNTMSSCYWSSTIYAFPTYAWHVYFDQGYMDPFYKSNAYYVRAVRGGQQTPSFSNNGDGTITDHDTGLIWMQATADIDNDGSADLMKWENALSYCENLDFATQKDWRLPTIKELQSIVDYDSNPAIDTAYFPNFPNTMGSPYWSSTTHVQSTGYVWRVNFYAGEMNQVGKSDTSYVRAVRGGQ